MRKVLFLLCFIIFAFLIILGYNYYFIYGIEDETAKESTITKDNYAIENIVTEETENTIIAEIVEVETKQTQEILINENIEEQQNVETQEISNNKKVNETTVKTKNNNAKEQTKELTKQVEINTQEETKSNEVKPVQTTPIEETIIETKQETPQVQEEIQQEVSKPRFCSKGGPEHLDGDGPYEYGYYVTWDEAWNACKEYMKNLTSGANYMVGQCHGCGLYYFYCKTF